MRCHHPIASGSIQLAGKEPRQSRAAAGRKEAAHTPAFASLTYVTSWLESLVLRGLVVPTRSQKQ